jgi:hypothetical protein
VRNPEVGLFQGHYRSKIAAMKSEPIPAVDRQIPLPEVVRASDQEEVRPVCPVCGGRLFDIRRKLCCVQYHRIIETCCD